MPDSITKISLADRFRKLVPLKWVRVSLVCLAGTIVGLGLLMVHISNALSYLSDDPKACINCHIMAPQYATWMHSSHREKTVCNDCHVPHDNVFRKYLFKAKDGMRHAAVFTIRREPQVFKLNPAATEVVQENCKRCHINVVGNVSLVDVTGDNFNKGQGLLCWQCHRETPHGRVVSQAATPNALIPGLSEPAPKWMKNLINRK